MKKILAMLMATIIVLTIVLYATPGDSSDPLVSLSYVREQLNLLRDELTGKIDLLQTKIEENADQSTDTTPDTEDGTTADYPVFEIHQFAAGTQITFGQSTEFIVRRGEAIVIDPLDNNIPDLTTGIDIKKGQVVPLNHQLLCPRDDGRGITVSAGDEFWIMIKGSFTVVQ